MKRRTLVTSQIILRMGIVLSIVGLITSLITIYFIKGEVENYLSDEVHTTKELIVGAMDTNQQSAMIVEHLMELKLSVVSRAIAKELRGKTSVDVSQDELKRIKEEFDLYDLSLFERKGADIVITRSTDPKEVGQKTKTWGYWYTAFDQLLQGQQVNVGKGYAEKNFWVGPISKAEWNNHYYKYAYYYDGTTSFIIDPYLLDEDIYTLTHDLGPEQVISNMVKENPMIEDIGIINVSAWLKGKDNKVIEPDHDQPVLYGHDSFAIPQDKEMLQGLTDGGEEKSVSFTVDGRPLIKYYIPIGDHRVMTFVANFSRQDSLEGSLVALLAIAFSCCFIIILLLVRMIAMRRLQPLQDIEKYLGHIAQGDFSTTLVVKDKNELGWLADQIVQMGGKLEGLIREVNNRAQDAISQMAYYDDLTSLPNRRLFKLRLQAALREAALQDKLMAVMFLDLDRFKNVNDSLGHTTGDLLLKHVASRLTSALPEGAILARMGGDEFTLLLPQIAHEEEAVHAAKLILEAFEQPLRFDLHEFHLSTSVGVALFPRDGEDDTTLLKNADTAMYHAKENGRNNFQIYSKTMNATILEQLQLEQRLHHALENEEFVLYYQPQVNVQRGEMIGMEALIRWKHPEHGLISPAMFIPIAENTGLIEPIGDWVLRTACRQMKSWQEQGLRPARVAVNLSARQFQRPNFVDQIANILDETGLEPEFLELEVTESLAMTHADRAISTLHDLKKLGVKLSIDDFGTGYSSLNYLKRFPIDTLKIDRSFVGDITSNTGDATIVTTIIAMAHTLQLTVIAEGVENEEQMQFLYDQGCDEMQGFLFSLPLQAEDLKKLLQAEDAPRIYRGISRHN
jgi:diguanylate cyclase